MSLVYTNTECLFPAIMHVVVAASLKYNVYFWKCCDRRLKQHYFVSCIAAGQASVISRREPRCSFLIKIPHLHSVLFISVNHHEHQHTFCLKHSAVIRIFR